MPMRDALTPLLESLRTSRLLCVGDVMLDRYVYGEVERISPEAPIPVMRIRRETAMLGGAGNVVCNMVALGASVAFVSLVGKDEGGREVARLLSGLPRAQARLVTEPGRQTPIKTRYVAAGQQLMRADLESVDPIGPAAAERLLEEVAGALDGAAALVVSDYAKGALPPPVLARLIAMAAAAGVPAIVDPKGRDYTVYRGAALLTPNRKELSEATGMGVDGDEAVVAAARRLVDTCGVGAVLVTRSQDGMSLVAAGEVHHLPAEAREVFDVSGAGDTVVAALSAALAVGARLPDAAALANIAAGIVVGKAGTAVALPGEIAARLTRHEQWHGGGKVMTLPQALDAVGGWRLKGLRVGFTNGCFDLLHPGHISLLAQARAACDRLVVGLNTDASVVRLKGPARPVQPEQARATVLASLAAVDAVVPFDQDTPLDLIEALRPDVLVKGADYTVETVVGADLVQGYGGKVLLAELLDGFSTTGTIARIGG